VAAAEQERVMEALKKAITLEQEGEECYQQAGQQIGNEAGRKLLQSLALEEDEHRQKLMSIYKALKTKKGWPDIKLQPDKGQYLRELFSVTCQISGSNVKAAATELKALDSAIEKEKKSYDFYTQQSKNATFDSEKEFYESIAGEEREHELILLNYKEYLSDPVDWFTLEEHHSLDGG
jgi:rubrerythrin